MDVKYIMTIIRRRRQRGGRMHMVRRPRRQRGGRMHYMPRRFQKGGGLDPQTQKIQDSIRVPLFALMALTGHFMHTRSKKK